jgi:hypothetical protein
MDQQQQAAIVWSRLPDLNIRPCHQTSRSDRGYGLHTSQLSIWTGFEEGVRQDTASVFGSPINFVPPVPANEHYVVATESGISARIVGNIFQVGAVFEAQGFNLRFRDSPAGSSIAFDECPDAVIENLQAPGRALVVGEFKTPWTRDLDRMTDYDLALLLGIPVLQTEIPRYRC